VGLSCIMEGSQDDVSRMQDLGCMGILDDHHDILLIEVDHRGSLPDHVEEVLRDDFRVQDTNYYSYIKVVVDEAMAYENLCDHNYNSLVNLMIP
jgi:hypothetical protein